MVRSGPKATDTEEREKRDAADAAPTFGAIVLRQIPTVRDAAGITLVVPDVAIDREKQRKDMRWTT